jgi:hypothetical protein
MGQKDCTTCGKAPHDNVQTRPRYQRVFRSDPLDSTNQRFGSVRGENRNSRKIGAKDSGGRVWNEYRNRESV